MNTKINTIIKTGQRTQINEKIMVIQMQSWERLNKLREDDPKEFAKHEHLHTTHPLLYKSEEEKKRIEATLRKYITLEKQDKKSEKEATMFGQESKLDTSCDSTASSDNEESSQGVYFSEEEI